MDSSGIGRRDDNLVWFHAQRSQRRPEKPAVPTADQLGVLSSKKTLTRAGKRRKELRRFTTVNLQTFS